MTPEELRMFLATGKKPIQAMPEPERAEPQQATSVEPTPAPLVPALPSYAPALLDSLRELASERDFADVELSASSLAETMAVIQEIPYPPDIFIDECLDTAVTALENQKRVYIQRVMSGEKQSGIRNKKKATALAMEIDLSDIGQVKSSDGTDLSDCFVL